MKAIRCSIYKDRGGDCSNGGISSRYNDVLIVTPDGWIDVDGTEENLVELCFIEYGGKTHYYLEPVARPTGVGWMYGGTIVSASDARFPFDYPLKLHDRQESQELYDMLSR